MLYGLMSALGFGLGDACAALSTRRVGVLWTLFVIQLLDLLGLSMLLLTPLPGPLKLTHSASMTIVVIGALGTLSYFSFYRALQLGPISIASPVFASSAAIPVVLSVVVLGERLSALAAVGAALTLSGVVLASIPSPSRESPRAKGGTPYALAACFAWGTASFLIGRMSQDVGWFLPVWGARAVQFIVVSAVVIAARIRSGQALARIRNAGFASIAGVADAIGVATFARGSQVGLVSVVAAVSATFPFVVIAAGVSLFHERPTPLQWIGIGVTVVGLVLLGLGR